MRDFLGCLILAIIIVLSIKACRADKDVIEYTIDVVHNYNEYADSIFNK